MSIELFDLTEKVAVVTGSGRGLGATIAKGLAKAGASSLSDLRPRDWD